MRGKLDEWLSSAVVYGLQAPDAVNHSNQTDNFQLSRTDNKDNPNEILRSTTGVCDMEALLLEEIGELLSD